MTQKLVVGLLMLTVIGALAVGVYDATRAKDGDDEPLLANTNDAMLADGAAGTAENDAVPAPGTTQDAIAQPAAPTQTPAPSLAQDMTAVPVQQNEAIAMVGDPWSGSGSITALDTNGMTLALSMTESIYVELGPPHAWQDQGVPLTIGQFVTIDGFYNGEQYHAARVTTQDGAQLQLRTTDGMPLWSGGADGSQAHGDTGQQGEPQVQVTADEWVTLEGTITDVLGSTLTMQTTDGALLDLQLGQRSFIDSQGIMFAIGDPVSVLGFWQGTAFKAGEITKTETGERLMLLDPNGRPLWGGPGRNGAGGQGGQAANTQQTGDDPLGAAGQGSGNGNGGGGNGYQGGRNPGFQRGGQGQQGQTATMSALQ